MKYSTTLSAVALFFSLAEGVRAMNADEVAQLATGVDEVTKVVRQELRAETADATRVLLVGATGSGKSTLLHLLAGIPLIVKKDVKFGELCLEPAKMLFAVAPGPDSVTTTSWFFI